MGCQGYSKCLPWTSTEVPPQVIVPLDPSCCLRSLLAHPKELLNSGFLSWDWHPCDYGDPGWIWFHIFVNKLVPHESDRGFKLKFLHREMQVTFATLFEQLHQATIMINVCLVLCVATPIDANVISDVD